jgi:hypothetical protein
MTREQYAEGKIYEEFTPIDTWEATIEHLNDDYSFSCVGGPFVELSPGDMLSKYDYDGFQDYRRRYVERMILEKKWAYVGGDVYDIEAKWSYDGILNQVKDCDPYHISGTDSEDGWYYYDDKAFCCGPFGTEADAYDNAVQQYWNNLKEVSCCEN